MKHHIAFWRRWPTWRRCGESRVRVVVARELTKLHEEFLRGTAARSPVGRCRPASAIRGEIVLLIDATPVAQPANAGGSVLQQVSQLMEAEGLEEKDALKRVARERGVSKSEVYRELQRERSKK